MKKRWLIGAALAGAAASGTLVKKLWLEKYRNQAVVLEKTERECNLFYTWLLLREKNVDLTEYFVDHDLQTVAILGMDKIGRRFYDELQGHRDVRAVYGVEAECLGAVHETLTVYRLGDDPLPPADCMVICDLERTAEKIEAVKREFFGTVTTLTAVLAELLERREIECRDGAIPGWPPAE